MNPYKPIVLLLGTNMGDRENNLVNAVKMLEACEIPIKKKSFIYETEPMDLKSQPYFLNQAAEISTNKNPHEILEICREIENSIGRVRTIRKGPRIIDIDILIWGSLVMSDENITIPHPSMHQRPFALIPLLDITHKWVHPLFQKDLNSLLRECLSACKVSKLKNPWFKGNIKDYKIV